MDAIKNMRPIMPRRKRPDFSRSFDWSQFGERVEELDQPMH
jgi:hypothetical protein